MNQLSIVSKIHIFFQILNVSLISIFDQFSINIQLLTFWTFCHVETYTFDTKIILWKSWNWT